MRLTRPIMPVMLFLLLCFNALAQDRTADWSRLQAGNHPRLLLDDAELALMKSDLASGENTALKLMHDAVMHIADSVAALDEPILYQKDASGKRILAVARKALTRIFTCAYAYRFTDDDGYLEHAEKDLLDICAFPDWNPSHFLDAAELSAAAGLGFDWLYGGLQESTRRKLAETVDRFAFKPASDEVLAWFYDSDANWNQVCNGGLTVAALAMYERMDTASTRIINDAIWKNTPAVKKIYSPDGNYAEGPEYWCYGTMYQVLLNEALKSALGSDFGLSEIQGFDRTAGYMLFTSTTTDRTFNYYDNPPIATPAYPMWYFADRADSPEMLCHELKLLEDGHYAHSDGVRLLPMFVQYAARLGRRHEGRLSSEHIALPTDHIYHGEGKTPVVMVRGDWSRTGSDSFLGMVAGSPSSSHSHMDGGSFVYECGGVRWSSDLPPEKYETLELRMKELGGDLWDYRQDSHRWNVFRMSNKMHSTLTINDHKHNVKGNARMIKVLDTPDGRGAVMDLSGLLCDDLDSAMRSAMLREDGSLIITDELQAKPDGSATVRWSMVTEADPEITADGIVLRKDGKKLLLRTMITQGNPTYTIWNTDPLAYSSPFNGYDSPNNGCWCVGFETVLASGGAVRMVTTLELLAE